MTTTVFTVTSAAWVDLGAGPALIECVSGGEIYVKESASQPAATEKGHLVKGYSSPDSFREFATTTHVWARALSGSVDVHVSPITSDASGAATSTLLTDALIGDYESVAASQTDQVLGATGAAGDYLSGLLIVPATTAAGAVSIKDGAGSAISIFAGGGTTALSVLVPIFVPLGVKSVSGAWKVTTGANVSVLAVGNFT